MTDVLIQIFALIGLGVLWSFWRPGGMDIVTLRTALTSVIYYVFLPALVLKIIWQANLSLDSVRIALAAAVAILVSLAVAALVCRACRTNRPVAGAVMLAAAFPNATYLGLPLLEKTFGPWAKQIVIEFDMFACFPLVMTVGILIASHYGNQPKTTRLLLTLPKVPALMVAVLAVGLNLLGVKAPTVLIDLLGLLSGAVIPVMLFAVGLALQRGLSEWRHLPAVIPVAGIQLFLMPLVIWGFATLIGVSGETLHALVIEAALPSMALGVVICDRYGLNSGIYAAAMALTTLASFVTLPLWYQWLS